MKIHTRLTIVKGVTKILQMDQILPRRIHGSLMNTLSSSLPAIPFSSSSSSAAFARSALSPSSPFSKTIDFHQLFLKDQYSFSVFTMGKNLHDTEEVRKDQQREGFTEAPGDHTNGGAADDVLPHILNIYGSRARPQDFEIYAPNATFEDPLMRAEGVKQIKSAFYSIAKIFSESRIVEYSIKEDVISPGKKEISIDTKQYYKFWGKDIHMISLIKLQMENGKIVRHEDRWDKKPLRNRETVKLPLMGRMIEMSRRASMLATHALMGFGKDPTM